MGKENERKEKGREKGKENRKTRIGQEDEGGNIEDERGVLKVITN